MRLYLVDIRTWIVKERWIRQTKPSILESTPISERSKERRNITVHCQRPEINTECYNTCVTRLIFKYNLLWYFVSVRLTRLAWLPRPISRWVHMPVFKDEKRKKTMGMSSGAKFEKQSKHVETQKVITWQLLKLYQCRQMGCLWYEK